MTRGIALRYQSVLGGRAGIANVLGFAGLTAKVDGPKLQHTRIVPMVQKAQGALESVEVLCLNVIAQYPRIIAQPFVCPGLCLATNVTSDLDHCRPPFSM